LDNPVVDDWALLVQRGTFSPESVHLSYSGWKPVP
jgi:hypothetical protein